MAHTSAWTSKILALLRANNADAAIAQIRVAPSTKELRLLQKLMAAPPIAGKWPSVDAAVVESLDALSAPRLHRSP